MVMSPATRTETLITFTENTVQTLSELSAKCVASHIPFELVEHVYPPVPEQLQLQIAFWSFPDSEDDIRLYSCLANGSADEFQRGEHLCRDRAVKDVLQIGKYLVVLNNYIHHHSENPKIWLQVGGYRLLYTYAVFSLLA